MKTLHITILLAICQILVGQPSNEWAWQIGGNGQEIFRSIDLDDEGNIYTGGHYQFVSDVDPHNAQVENTQATGSGPQFLLAKYDANGEFVWKTNDISNNGGTSRLREVHVNDTYIYGIGDFSGGSDIDLHLENLSPFNANLLNDIFFFQADHDGNILNGHPVGGFGEDYGYDITTDSNGDVWLTGVVGHSNSGSSTIQIVPGLTVPNPNPGHQSIFVAKLSASLSGIWSGVFGNIEMESGGATLPIRSSIEIDSNDNVIVAGNFVNTMALDPASSVQSNYAGRGMFLVKLDNLGNQIWGHLFGDTDLSETPNGNDFLNDLTIDSDDNIIIGGRIGHPVNFDFFGGEQLAVALTSSDAFVAKYSSDAELEFVRTIPSSGSEDCLGVHADSFNNIYCTGTFTGVINFGGAILNSPGSKSNFTVCLSASGAEGWATGFGSNLNDSSLDVHVSDDGTTATILTCGYIQTQLVPTIFTSNPIFNNPAGGDEDAFVASFTDTTIHGDGDPCNSECPYDFNGDHMVNTSDLLIFLGQFGTSCL